MTTGATGQLGLALPVQGELSGTWGDTVNNGITQYTNIAIAGTLTLTGDGAVTLANTTGDASASNITSTLAGAGTVTAQFAIVKVSGTTTTKVVTGPSYSKTYVVDNASSYAVTFKASGQTGVSVAAAEKVTVVFNGTDYIKLAGTIANAAGSNTQIQFNNGGLFGASSSLTWDGTTLSSTQINITGQGSLRLQDTTGGEYVGLRAPASLGASYTLTWPADDGTSGQALITDGSGGLSWSTAASGDVYGPGSSTDNAVARFDSTTGKLLQNSVVIIGDTGDVSGVGTLSATTLTLTNALGTAYGGTGLTSFTSGGVVYASSSSALATGSGLTFNGADLTVANGDLTIGTNGKKLYVNYIANNSGTDLNINGLSNTIFTIAGTETFRTTSTSLYTASGISVGIGLSNPASYGTLAVNNSSNGGSIVILKNTTQTGNLGNIDWMIGSGSATDFAVGNIYAGGNLLFVTKTSGGTAAERMRLDSAGNLGLGVTPSAWNSASKALQVGVVGSISQQNNGTFNYMTGAYEYTLNAFKYLFDSYAAQYKISHSDGKHSWYTAPSGTAGNVVTFTQAMTLDASGNLGVGTTSPSGWGTTISVSNTSTDSGFTFQGSTRKWGIGGGYTDGALRFYDYTANAERARITSAGDTGFGTANPPTKVGIYVPNSTGPVLTLGGANGLGNVTGVRIGYGEGGSYCKSAILFENTDGSYATGSLHLCVDSVQDSGNATIADAKLTINSSGYVGIGESSPSQKLVVRDVNKIVDGIGNVFFATTDSQAADKGASLSLGGLYTGSSAYSFAAIAGKKSTSTSSDASGYLAMYTTNTSNTVVERARIDNAGNLLVGTTSTTGSVGNYANVLGGVFRSFSGSVSSPTNTYTTLFAASAGTIASYLVTVWVSADDVGNYQANVIVNTQGGSSTKVTTIVGGNLLVFQMSGYNFQAAQLSGGTATINYSAIRIAA